MIPLKPNRIHVKTAIVTGAASGIAQQAVARMRSRGIQVVAADRNPQLTEMYAGDTGVLALVGDITDEAFVTHLVKQAEQHFGPVDRLFHSAAIMPGGRTDKMPAQDFLRIMHINYQGTVLVTQAVLPSMQARKRGQIIVLGSLAGYLPSTAFSAYSASKAAVNSYTETLAHEQKKFGLHVLLVAPTVVKTPLLAQATGGPKYLEELNLKEKSPRMITPKKVLDDIDRALARRQWVCLPGAAFPYAVRRFSPSLAWKLIERVG